MPTGPRGERRPADVIGATIMVAKIATGEIANNPPPNPGASEAAMLVRRHAPLG
jgi:hypothetical protein